MSVLVVDDNRGTLNALELWLARAGHKAILCADPHQGLELLRQGAGDGDPVRLVLTDQILPGQTGLEFIRGCQELRPGIKAILMTAYQDQELKRQALALPGCGFLAKPFTPQDLLKALKEVEGSDAG